MIVEQENQLENIPNHITKTTYQSEEVMKEEIDLLIISDMPEREEDLIKLLSQIKTKSILVNYDLFEKKLNHIPNRDDFKNLYSFIIKEKSVDMKAKMNFVIKQFNWSREQVIFMILVFIELEFIHPANGVVTINPNSDKKDLTESKHYQKEFEKDKNESKLYYSGLDDLKVFLFENIKLS